MENAHCNWALCNLSAAGYHFAYSSDAKEALVCMLQDFFVVRPQDSVFLFPPVISTAQDNILT